MCVWMCAQLGPTLCDPIDCSPPGSSVHGILQTRILQSVAFPPPGDLVSPEIEPHLLCLLHWQGDSLPLQYLLHIYTHYYTQTDAIIYNYIYTDYYLYTH